jgi:hypothetical protein
MSQDDAGHESFEDTLRSILREVGRSAERAAHGNVEAIADAVGVEPARAKQWLDGAATWLGAQTAGYEAPRTWSGKGRAADPLGGAQPHPLDTPTAEQGLALAALDSGRWSVEPGSNTLSTHGQGPGPGPIDAIGLYGELRAHDWITGDGTVTVVGRHALTRWLAAADRH